MPPCASSVSAGTAPVQSPSRSATNEPQRQFHKRGQDARWPWYRSPKGLTARARRCRLTLNDATVIEAIAVRVFGPCAVTSREGADVTVRGIALSTGMQRTSVERCLRRLLRRHVVYRRPNPYAEDGSFLWGLYEPETWTAEDTVEHGAAGWPLRETVKPPEPEGRLLIFPPRPQAEQVSPGAAWDGSCSPECDGSDLADDVARYADRDEVEAVDNEPAEAFFDRGGCPHSEEDGCAGASSVKKMIAIALPPPVEPPAPTAKPDRPGSAWGPSRYYVHRERIVAGRRVWVGDRLTDAIGSMLDAGKDGCSWDLVTGDKPRDVPDRLVVRIGREILAAWGTDWSPWIVRECILEARSQRTEREAFREAARLEGFHAIREAIRARWPGVRALAERAIRESETFSTDPAVAGDRERVIEAVADAARRVERALSHPLDEEVRVDAAVADAALDHALATTDALVRSNLGAEAVKRDEQAERDRLAEESADRAEAVSRLPALVERALACLADALSTLEQPQPVGETCRDQLRRHVWTLHRESAERSVGVLRERIAELRATSDDPASLDLARFYNIEQELRLWPLKMTA